MTLPRFHVDMQLAAGSRGVLDERQAQQVRSVLRLRAGARILIFDGSGAEASAELLTFQQSDAQFEVVTVDFPQREPPLDLTVGLALLRGDRFEIAVQKLTELGVRRLVPLSAERCVVSFDVPASWEKRVERYRRIAREAAEQSERVTLVAIESPVAVEAFLEREPVTALVERASAPQLTGLPLTAPMALGVGPEGGWSPRELRAIERDAASVASLGRLILRAETAAITAAAVLVQRSWAQSAQAASGA